MALTKYRSFKGLSLVFLAMFLGIMPMGWSQQAEILPLGHDLYTILDSLTQLAGISELSSVRPWTVGQARVIYQKILDTNPELVSGSLGQEAENQLSYFDRSPESIRIEPVVSL